MRWLPILGEFDVNNDEIVFKGRRLPPPPSTEPQPQPEGDWMTIGILLTDVRMVSGRLRGWIKFDEVVPLSVCEFVVAYDERSRALTNAGLGGDGGMFSIREWVVSGAGPQAKGAWTSHHVSGERVNLRPGVTYEVEVRVAGSNIVLSVDGVVVTDINLPAEAKPRQVGIFCVNASNVYISRFSAETERPKAFIVMQFSSPYNEVYAHVIKDACEAFEIDAERADEIYGPGMIIKDITDRISKCQVVIADISPANPNVYFEVGYALALSKPIILLAQHRSADAPLPFDLSAFRVLFYDNSIGGKPKLEAGLRSHLQQIFGTK